MALPPPQQVAHAVDLDVYVEPISVTSPRNRHSPQTETEAAEAAAAAALAEDEQGQRKKKTKDKKSGVKGQGAGQPPPPPAMLPAPGVLAEASDVAEESSVHGPKVRRNSIVLPGTEVRRKSIMLPSLAPSTNELAKPSNAPNDVTTKHRLMRVKVGEKPLLVRAKVDKESQQIGRILPGQVVTIVEERIAEDGEVRACIALDSVALSVDGSRPSKFSPLNSPTSVTASPAPEPERVDTPPPDLEGTSEEQRSAQTSGDDMKTGQGPGTGWVTLVKEGRKLVTSRVKLGPGARRQFVQQWARRKANDVVSRRRGGVTVNELTSDPTGIGFGFGGVQPGTLHAHGQLHEVHRVSYSIGLAGQYLMHVRLRQQATAVPGSPFNLTVVPGTADAKTTKLDSTAPLRGMVGLTGPDVGCSLGLHTADKMGNPCIVGGAAVRISVDHEDVEADVIDNNDGTYKLQWRSKYSGTFRTRVMVEAGGASEDVVGSPMEFTLTSSTPELSKSDLLGDGLRHSIAGVTALIKIKFVDQFANTAIPGPSFKFGMSIGKDKDKVANAKPHDFTGEWEAGDTGIYEIMYTPTLAGSNELHVWCDPNSKGERLSFPGSPFHVTVTPGAASPDVSVIEQWTKLQKEEKNDKYGKSAASDPGTIHAGDTVSIRPQIFDLYGNPTTLPESGLDVVHKLPDGHVTGLGYTTQQRGGLTSYDIRHDTTYAGAHEIDVLLNGVSIKGSPVCFSVMPDKPDPTNCKLTVPLELTAAGEKGTMYTNTPYACTLKAFDKFDNECKMGGLTLSTRLQVVKQGVHDQTTLVPSNHSCEWVDNGDGTYSIHMTMNVMCAVKLFINMDKNLPAGAGELPSIHLPFLSNPPDDTKDAALSKVPAAVAPSESKTSKNEKLKAAAGEIMEGFGLAEDRREKDALVVAAEAFADATSFAFDKPPASPSMKRRSSMAPIPLGKDSSTPNPNLFERALTSGSGKSDKR